MIKLQSRPENSYRNVEKIITATASKAELVDFYKQYIERYKVLDKQYAFTEAIDEDFIFQQIDEKFPVRSAPFYNMPFGVKDIFNTRVLPTSMGSDIWRGFKAGNNARVVDEIADRGGIVFSKTTTAEFAVHFISPESTVNPYNAGHITGTSSSGSAVAVACGALPIALGTQTAGSIVRPASFCGVYGFKPSFGAIDRTGVLKTNDTLDTIGLLGADVFGLRKTFYQILQKGRDYPFSVNYFQFYEAYKNKPAKKLKVAILSEGLNVFKNYESYVMGDLQLVEKQLSGLFDLQRISGVEVLNGIHELHEKIYSKSLSYYFENEIKHYDSVSPVMRDMIGRGDKISSEEYISAIEKQPAFKTKFDEVFADYDFIITPSTASYAPEIGKTETPDTCLIWTFLGYPAISIPLFMNEEKNLPYGLQIVSKKYNDFSLLDFAETVQQQFV